MRRGKNRRKRRFFRFGQRGIAPSGVEEVECNRIPGEGKETCARCDDVPCYGIILRSDSLILIENK